MSDPYLIKVLPRPVLNSFETQIEYPAYTMMENEIISNTGELVVPEGSKVTWRFFTTDVDKVYFEIGEEPHVLEIGSSNVFEIKKKELRANISYLFQVFEQVQPC